MNKTLRISLLSLLTLFAGTLMAQTTVTLDFDNDYQMLFPTLAGVSGNDSQAGDFTGATYSTQVQGVMVLVAPDEGARTPSRIWYSAPRLRMYSGQFAVIGDGITKIEFTGSSQNFNLVPLTGTLNGYTWTGDDDMVMFNVTKNTQISKIVVTMGGGGGVDPGNDDGLSYDIISGQITETDNQLKLDFFGIDEEQNIEVNGQMVFDFVDNACTNAYASITYPTVESAQAGYNEALASAEKDGYTDVRIDGMTVSMNSTSQFAGQSKEAIKYILNAMIGGELPQLTGNGTLGSPFTAADANIVAGVMLSPGETSDDEYYIKGKVSDIKYPFDAQHATATFFISEDGTQNGEQFQAYSVYYLENKPWVDGYKQISVGDNVILYGKVTNYEGTPETASKKAYIYSLNGQTKAEDTPQHEVKLITVAEALQIIDALSDGKTTTETYQVKGVVTRVDEISTAFGNTTFIMADTPDAATGLTVYRAKGFDGQNITDPDIIKVGDEVVVEGKLQKYVKNGEVTPEVATGGHLVSINGQGSGISDVKADVDTAIIYNLSGQRVKNAQKGIFIVNGRKVVVK